MTGRATMWEDETDELAPRFDRQFRARTENDMGPRRWQITLRWMMIRIAVFAAALAFLVDAARQSEKYHCGNPLVEAMMIVFVLAVGYPLARAMVRANR
jgi:hypothetical protein